MSENKPCPFCGEIFIMDIQFEGYWRAECPICGACGPLDSTKEQAKKRWNNRDKS